MDHKGDGSFAGRPVVGGSLMGRNAGRGTAVYDISSLLGSELAVPGARATLSMRAEAFPLLNHSNLLERNGAPGKFPFELRVVF